MRQKKNQIGKNLFWITLGLALLVALFLVTGIFLENREKKISKDPTSRDSKLNLEQPGSQQCMELVQKRVEGLSLTKTQSILGWIPDKTNRRIVIWDQEKLLFKTYLLSLTTQSAQFYFDQEYPLFCKNQGGSHCLSDFGTQAKKFILDLASSNSQVLKDDVGDSSQFSSYGLGGGILRAASNFDKLSIPFKIDREKGLSFYPFLNTCKRSRDSRRWMPLMEGQDVYYVGWSHRTHDSLIYLVAPTYSQSLAVNAGGDSSENIYSLSNGDLVPSDCTKSEGESVILDVAQRGSLWVLLVERGSRRDVLFFELMKGVLRKAGELNVDILGGNPRRIHMLSDSSLWVETSNWLGSNIRSQIFRLSKDGQFQVGRAEDTAKETAKETGTPLVTDWLPSLAALRGELSNRPETEDIAVVSKGSFFNSWSLVLFGKTSVGQLKKIEISTREWSEKPDHHLIYWDKINPENYFILDMSGREASPLGTWIHCRPHEFK